MRLSKEDWAEIYYALDSKRSAIENGEYDPCLEHADKCRCNEDWIAGINIILKAIGPEGKEAFSREDQLPAAR